MKFCLLFCLLIAGAGLRAQAPSWEWAKEAFSPNDEQVQDIYYDVVSGQAIVCGFFEGTLNSSSGFTLGTAQARDAFVARVDLAGNVLGAFRIGGSGNDEARSVVTNSIGEIYVCGYFSNTVDFDPGAGTYTLSSGSGSRDGFMAKYSATGNFIWAVRIGGNNIDEANALFEINGSVFVTGMYEGAAVLLSTSSASLSPAASQAQGNFFGAKYNSSGVVQWVVSGGGINIDVGNNVVADTNAAFFLGTYTQQFTLYGPSGSSVAAHPVQNSGKSEAFVLAVDQSGTFLWTKNASSSDDDTGYGLAQDGSSIFIGGSFKGNTISFPNPSPQFTRSNQGGADMYIASLSKSTGLYQWVSAQTGTGPDDENCYVLKRDHLGNLIAAGSFRSSWSLGGGSTVLSTSGNEDIFVCSFSSVGNFLWGIKAGTGNRDIARAVSSIGNGGYLVGGEHFNGATFGDITLTNSGGKNIFVAKTCNEIISNNSISASQTLCVGGTPSPLTGSLPTGGTGTYSYFWQQSFNGSSWTAASGTNTLINYSPPSLSATTYYRRRVSVFAGCFYTSNTVTITSLPTVADAGVNQVVCATQATLSATPPVFGIGTWSVLGGTATILNTLNAVSAVQNLSPGSNGFIWTIFYPGCPIRRDTVFIHRDDFPTPPVTFTPLSVCSLSLQLAGNLPAVGSGTWSLVSGTATILQPSLNSSAVSGLAPGNHVFQWSVGNGVCPVLSSTLAVQRDDFPTPALAGSDSTVCRATFTLNGNMPSVGTGSWSSLTGSSILLNHTLNIAPITSLSVGQNIFEWRISNGVCPPSVSTVQVTRDDLPTLAFAGSNVTICAASVTLAANQAAVGTGSWTSLSGSTFISNPFVNAAVVDSLAVGPNIYEWRISNGVCPATSATVEVFRDDFPTPSSAGQGSVICSNSVVLNGNAPSTGSGLWVVLSGSAQVTSASLNTTTAYSLSPDTNVFQWIISNGVCAPSTSSVIVIRDELPDISVAGTNTVICDTSYFLQANLPSVGTGSWSVLSGTSSIANPAANTTSVSGLSVGSNIFKWEIGNGVCPVTTSTVEIVRDDFPDVSVAGTNTTVCATGFTLGANLPSVGTGSWSVLSGTSSIANPAANTTSVSGLSVGSNIFEWEIGNGVCPVTTSTVEIVRDDFPTVSVAGTNTTVCATAFTLGANLPSVGTGSWSVLSGTSSIANPAANTTSVSGLSVGSNIFEWEIGNGVCPATSSTVEIVRDDFPTVSVAGTNTTVCATGFTLGANLPSVGTGSWSVLSGTSSIVNPAANTTSVSGLSVGSNIFKWEIGNGVCPVTTSTVEIVRDDFPTVSVAGTNTTVCATGFTLGANLPSVGTGSWSVLSGTSSIVNPATNTTSVSGLSVGSNIFEWEIGNGVCPATSSTVEIVRDDFPTVSVAGTNTTVCATGFTLGANLPSVGTGSWSVLSGTSSVANPAANTTSVSGLSVGSNIFEWEIGNGVCPVTTSTVEIVRDDFPTVSVAGTNTTVCATAFTLGANLPSVGTGSWSVLSGASTVNNPLLNTTNVSGLSVGINVFEWRISNGVCLPSISTVQVIRDDFPDISVAGTDATVCALSYTLSANSPSVGTGTWSVITGNSQLSSVSSPSAIANLLSPGLNQFQWMIVNGVCAPSSSTVGIYRYEFPTLAVAGNDFTVCGQSATVAAGPVAVGAGSWTVNTTALIQSATQGSTAVQNLQPGINTFYWSVYNGVCPPSVDSVLVYSQPEPDKSQAGNDIVVCDESVLLSANQPSTGSGIWSALNTSATLGAPSSPSTTVSQLQEGQNFFLWTITVPHCPSNSDTVVVSRDLPPSPANAGVDQTICGKVMTVSASPVQKGSGSWILLSGRGEVQSPDSDVTVLSNLAEGDHLLVWEVSNGICPASRDTIRLIIYHSPENLNVGEDRYVCSDTVLLKASFSGTATGRWRLLSGAGTISDSLLAATQVSDLNFGENRFVYELQNGVCALVSDEIKINRDSTVKAEAGEDQVLETATAELNALLPPGATGQWSVPDGPGYLSSVTDPRARVSNLQPGSNVLIWMVKNGSCPVATDAVELYVKPFQVPNAISPNGDGINDVFKITSLEYYGGGKLSIFNRWGAMVYQKDDYRNDWGGTSMNDSRLPDDTYYYILEIPNMKNMTGFVIIKSR